MPEEKPKKQFLASKAEIMQYCSFITSEYLFKKFIERGLPARYDGGWFASTNNIDKWWDSYTGVSNKKMPEEESDNAR
jgi:hypothetical protein